MAKSFFIHFKLHYLNTLQTTTMTSDRFNQNKLNKCIGEDTKAAARQSPNCIKNKIK